MARVVNADGRTRDVVTIGASAGGVPALMHLLGQLPAGLPAIVGIVLHRSSYHETRLAWVLGRRAAMPVIEPEDGVRLEPGTVYVAPRDVHLLFHGGRARLSHGPKEHRTRPAADPLFRSAAESYGARVAGVLLTGYGNDGVPGMVAIKAAGGLSLVQDPREAQHPVMPTHAIVEDDVDAVLPLDGLAAALVALAHGRPFSADGASASVAGRVLESTGDG